MKNKKGFTLVEVMVVIVILSLLTTFIFSRISNIDTKTKEKLYESKINAVLAAAMKYGSDNIDELNRDCTNISILDLINNGYLTEDIDNDGNYINPLTNETMNDDEVCVYYNRGQITASLLDNELGEIKVTLIGTHGYARRSVRYILKGEDAVFDLIETEGYNLNTDLGSISISCDKSVTHTLNKTNGKIIFTVKKANEDTTCYIEGNANKYTLTFNPNTGEVSPTSKEIVYDSTYGYLPTPTKYGYTSLGWYTDINAGNEIVSTDIVKVLEDQTLFAHWQINSYRMDYNPDNNTYGTNYSNGARVKSLDLTVTNQNGNQTYSGTGESDYNIVSEFNSTYTFTNIIYKDGYHYKDYSLSGSIIPTHVASDGSAFTFKHTYAGDINFSINTEANTYTVEYNGNGSTSGSTANSTHTYDTSKNLTVNGFTRTGYTFDGWNTKADGTGNSYTDGQSVSNLTSTNNGTVTLYAQWKVNFTTTFAFSMIGRNNVQISTTASESGYYIKYASGSYDVSNFPSNATTLTTVNSTSGSTSFTSSTGVYTIAAVKTNDSSAIAIQKIYTHDFGSSNTTNPVTATSSEISGLNTVGTVKGYPTNASFSASKSGNKISITASGGSSTGSGFHCTEYGCNSGDTLDGTTCSGSKTTTATINGSCKCGRCSDGPGGWCLSECTNYSAEYSNCTKSCDIDSCSSNGQTVTCTAICSSSSTYSYYSYTNCIGDYVPYYYYGYTAVVPFN